MTDLGLALSWSWYAGEVDDMRSTTFLRTAGVLGAAAVIGVAGMQIATASPTADSSASGYSEVSNDSTAAVKRGKRGPKGFTGPVGPAGPAGAPGQAGPPGGPGSTLVMGSAAQTITGGAISAAQARLPLSSLLANATAFALAPSAFTITNFKIAAPATTIGGFKYHLATQATNPVTGVPEGVVTTLTCEVAVGGRSCTAPGSLAVGAGNAYWLQPFTGSTLPLSGTFSFTIV
ncbi:MAG: hypothetical protein ACT4PP_06585 [Sporichthyaceae bacterium]